MIEGQFGVAERLALTYQGQQHVLEAVKLANTSHIIGSYNYERLALFLQASEIGIPLELRSVEPPPCWQVTLWDRVIPGSSTPESKSNTGAMPSIKEVKSIIEQADRVVAKISPLDSDSLKYEVLHDIVSVEMDLIDAVGTAVDAGDFGLAQSAIGRMRFFASKSGETDLLFESLAYLGVAMVKKGLSIAEIEQLPSETIKDIYLGDNDTAKQAVGHFSLDKELPVKQ